MKDTNPEIGKTIVVELADFYTEPFRIGFLQAGDCLWIGEYPDASMNHVKRWRYATKEEDRLFSARRARHPVSAGPAFLNSYDGLDPIPEPSCKSG